MTPFSLRMLAGLAFALAAPQAASALEMEVRGSQLLLGGPVVPGDAERFERALASMPVVNTIVMRNMPGGRLVEAMRMAETIRSRSLRTAVSGSCVSACAMMFIAGSQRSSTTEFPHEKTMVAFHGGYLPDGQNVASNDPGLLRSVARFTGGHMPADLTSRWLGLPQAGLVIFFDPGRTLLTRASTTPHRASVFVCRGDEAVKVRDCENLPAIDPYQVGVFTSRQPVEVNRR